MGIIIRNTSSPSYNPIFYLTLILLISVVYATRNLVSDGVNDDSGSGSSSYFHLPSIKSLFLPSESCEQTYGFLPCTKTALGNLFLIVVYGYLIFSGAIHLSNGAELLLEILGPGIVAGLCLPLIGAIPDSMLILVSGLSGSTATAQDQVAVGMGVLAGSTIMLLTVIWGACVLVGKCDLDNGRAVDEQDTKGFNLRDSGVTIDIWANYGARITAISVLPFLVVQLPQILKSTSGRQIAVLISLLISVLMVIGYCVYQVFQPWIQVRRLDYVKHKRVMTGFLKHLRSQAAGVLVHPDGSPNKEAIEKIYKKIDQDGDGRITEHELRAFMVGVEWMSEGVDHIDNALNKIMKELDNIEQDGQIDLDEFIIGISKLMEFVQGGNTYVSHYNFDEYQKKAEKEHFLLGDYSKEAVEEVKNPKATAIKAILLILVGIIITVAFADPLVDAVDSFSEATNIPSFFVSFVALPLITNCKGAVSVISFASRKKRRSVSLAFSEIYGEVTMGNVLGLSVLLALVYARGLTWDFSNEVLIVFLVCLVMGALTCFRTTFPLWTAIMAFLLCPLALMLIYVLNQFYGWS